MSDDLYMLLRSARAMAEMNAHGNTLQYQDKQLEAITDALNAATDYLDSGDVRALRAANALLMDRREEMA